MSTFFLILMLATWLSQTNCQSNETTNLPPPLKLGSLTSDASECKRIDLDAVIKYNSLLNGYICTCQESHQVSLRRNICLPRVSCSNDQECFQSKCLAGHCEKDNTCVLNEWSYRESKQCNHDEVCAYDLILPWRTSIDRVCMPRRKLTESCTVKEQCPSDFPCEFVEEIGKKVCSCKDAKFVDKKANWCYFHVSCASDFDCFQSNCHRGRCVLQKDISDGGFDMAAFFIVFGTLFFALLFVGTLLTCRKTRRDLEASARNGAITFSNQHDISISMAAVVPNLVIDAPPSYDDVITSSPNR